MNFDNDSYQVHITKNRKPAEDKCNKRNSREDSFLLPLFLAIVLGIWISPDLIDIRDYIPQDKYGNPYKLNFETKPFTD